MTPIAVYVHTPFCPSKCGYCDFNSYAMTGSIVDETVAAMIKEIQNSPWRGRPAKTIFFGGGTPTFLTSDQLLSILDAVVEAHPPIEDCEITSEANPGTVDATKFGAMRAGGFNRISLGAQSFVPEELTRLGRIHGPSEIGRAVHAARDAGFDNVNIDLMFALPGQSMRVWEQNLDAALALKTDHLSLYCLTIEPNTRYYKLHLKGMLDLPDDDQQVEMYEMACSKTAEAGLDHYEISNFSKPNMQSRHNLCYWRCEEYIGYGPGAVGRVGATRTTNLKHPNLYVSAVNAGEKLWCEREALDDEALRLERVMLGIRLSEGLDRTGLDAQAISALTKRGWLNVSSDRLHLTPEGKHFCSEVALALA
ncbi:MAG: radical SAM family heme chaperone HemW [Chthonomonas sp.]|nr:radical SAM family heme chaperone HemW [Chthonomonas sp.]